MASSDDRTPDFRWPATQTATHTYTVNCTTWCLGEKQTIVAESPSRAATGHAVHGWELFGNTDKKMVVVQVWDAAGTMTKWVVVGTQYGAMAAPAPDAHEAATDLVGEVIGLIESDQMIGPAWEEIGMTSRRCLTGEMITAVSDRLSAVQSMNAPSDKRAPAEVAVDRIIIDLDNRSGIGDMWDGIDEETQAEIKSSWVALVESAHKDSAP